MPLHGTGNKIAFSSDGTRLGMGLSTGPGVVRVSDAQILCEAATTAVPAVNARIFFSQDGTQLFGAGPNGVEELSAADCSLVRDLPAATNKSFYTFALSPSQRQLVTSDLGYGMELWDLATGALTGSALFDGVALPTIGLSFMPGDATRLVVTDRAAARMYCRSASDGWHID
jgi:hypothetical protein